MKMAEFARKQGWNRSTVTRLRQAGRLVIRDGLVDAVASLDLIAATADARRDDVAARHAGLRLQKTGKQAPEGARNGAGDPSQAPQPENPATAASASAADDSESLSEASIIGANFQAARAMKEKYLALQAQTEYQRLIGELLPRADVVTALDDVVAVARHGLDQLPHRTAPRLLGKDLDAIRAILREDVAALMREMHTDAQRQLAVLTQGARA